MPRLFSCIKPMDIYSVEDKKGDSEYKYTIQVGDLCFEEEGSDGTLIFLKSGFDRSFSLSYEFLTEYFVLA